MFVSHEASRTGAPRIGVDLLEALGGLPVERVTVLRWPGPLGDELARASDHFRMEPLRRLRVVLRRFRASRPLAIRLEERVAARVLRRVDPDLVYLNTVISACYARPALEQGRQVLLHVHELEPLASRTLARYQLGGLYARMRLVACSESVRENLARITGVPPDRIEMLPSLVNAERVRRLAEEGAQARPYVGSSPQETRSVRVGACGTADRRKGFDLWLAAAAKVGRSCPEIPARFTWIGRHGDPFAETSLRAAGEIAARVELTGEVSNPDPLLGSLDLLVLASREDPFPLVVLEAMCLGVPVVAFRVGGVPDQLGDAGVLVPPEDTAALAREIVALLRDPARRQELGARGRERFERCFGHAAFQDQVRRIVLG